MKKNAPMLFSLAVLLFAACGEETRDGQLSLTGSAPVRIVDEGGKTVEFAAGPTKVEIAPGSSNKFTVTVSQGKDKKAKFSGKAPRNDGDFNFSLRGKDIGQPMDFASARNFELFGQTRRRISDGMSCGYNGREVVEETWQSCNEDWKVSFNDAATQASVGGFHSRRENESCLIDSRFIYCREEPRHEPFPRRPFVKSTEDTAKKVSNLLDNGVKFD